jgi:hypothetical protein
MKEIYKVIYGKYKNEQGIPCHYQYLLGVRGLIDDEWLTPKKIIIRDKRIRVGFEELGIVHEFAYTDDVEIFRRDKIKTDAEQTTD